MMTVQEDSQRQLQKIIYSAPPITMKIIKNFWRVLLAVLIMAAIQFSQFQRSGDRNALIRGLVSLAVFIALFGLIYVLVIGPMTRLKQKLRAEIQEVGGKLPTSAMKIFTIKFPELEHLPPMERETILRRCAESIELRRFRRLLPFVGFIPVAISFPLFFMLLFHEHWRIAPACALFICVLFLSATAMLLGVAIGKVRIYRKLVKLELSK